MCCVCGISTCLVAWLIDGAQRLMRVLGIIAIEVMVTVIVEGLTSEMGVLGTLRDFLLDLGHLHGPDLLAEGVRHELLWNGLHSVHSVHQGMEQKLAHHLLHNLFQSCNTFHQRDVRGLFLIFRVEKRDSADVGGRDRSAPSCMATQKKVQLSEPDVIPSWLKPLWN